MKKMKQSVLVLLTTTALLFIATACNKDTKDDETPQAASMPAEAGKADTKAAKEPAEKAAAEGTETFDHSSFDGLLKKYVTEAGGVKYKAWKADADAMKALADYRKSVASAKVETLTKKEQLAFYLNAYNATVLGAILERYPIESVMKVDGFFKKLEYDVAGKKMSLDTLENTHIRGFGDARIHFGANCAAKSCPRLTPVAFTGANLDARLDTLTKDYIAKSSTFDEGAKSVKVSKIFEWFRGDFDKHEGSLNAFLAKYAPADKAFVKDAKVEFVEYDWALNQTE